MPDYPQRLIVPVHRAGWPFIAGGLLVTILLAWLAAPLLWLGLLPTAWMTYFFRDPPRVTPQGEDLVVSPADGTVQAITLRRPPPELELGEAPRTCISVFLNIFDVHVNRAPVGGRIARFAYHPGRFLNAAHDKASDLNERQSFRIETRAGRSLRPGPDRGPDRAPDCPLRRAEGAAVEAGQRVGLIRFGSRCDVYLPDGFAPMVAPGQRAIAGETVLRRRPPQFSPQRLEAELMLPKRRRRLRAQPLIHLVPNIFTVLSLCAGLTSIRYALDHRFELAVDADHRGRRVRRPRRPLGAPAQDHLQARRRARLAVPIS